MLLWSEEEEIYVSWSLIHLHFLPRMISTPAWWQNVSSIQLKQGVATKSAVSAWKVTCSLVWYCAAIVDCRVSNIGTCSLQNTNHDLHSSLATVQRSALFGSYDTFRMLSTFIFDKPKVTRQYFHQKYWHHWFFMAVKPYFKVAQFFFRI